MHAAAEPPLTQLLDFDAVLAAYVGVAKDEQVFRLRCVSVSVKLAEPANSADVGSARPR